MFEWLKAIVGCSMGGLAFLMLAGMLIVGVMAFIFTGKDRIMSITIISMLVFYVFSKLYCGPNLTDVLTMKPMGEKISAYIVKNGIPKSLKDIPDLPYELEGCERDKEFDYQENCKFKNKTIELSFQHGKYTVDNVRFEKATIEMKKSVNNTTETGILIDFEKKNGKFVQVGNMSIYSGKDSGICNPMSQ